MSIIDALITIFLIVGILDGIKKGAIKSVVSLVCFIIAIVISFTFKNYISTIMYKILPLINIRGLPVLSILVYEFIAFIMIFGIVELVLNIIVKVSGIIEKILKSTIILGFISKLLGMIVGFIESYILVFFILLVLSVFDINELGNSKLYNIMVYRTPILSSKTSYITTAVDEIMTIEVTDNYNKNITDIFLKYNIITKENLDILIEKGKISY